MHCSPRQMLQSSSLSSPHCCCKPRSYCIDSSTREAMFFKKCTPKDLQSVGKSDAKKLRSDVLTVIGKDNSDHFDLVVTKKDPLTKRRCRCNSGTSAFVYSVNDIPFFISLDSLSADDAVNFDNSTNLPYPIVPTVFFFLRLHQLLAVKGDDWRRLIGEQCVAAVCRGPTSQFILRGAHLMIPGIVTTTKKSDLVGGELALVYSLGNDVPYAVGLVTNRMAAKNSSGVGIFVVQCFHDSLWQSSENQFLARYALSSHLALIPPEFGKDDVSEKTELSTFEEQKVMPGEKTPDDEADELRIQELQDYVRIFADEDTFLCFSLCEAVKQTPLSLLPLPITQFTSTVVNSYPRDGVHTSPFQFKDTKYKKALLFFQKFPELLTIVEGTPGVYQVNHINKSAQVMRQHKCSYGEFVDTVHRKNIDEQTRALQARILADGTGVLRQFILSASLFFTASRDLNDDLARVLLLADDRQVPRDVLFPSIEQVMAGTVPAREEVSIDKSIFRELYTRKTLADNLKRYIRANNLLIVNAAKKGELPNVKIDKTLSLFLGAESLGQELPLDKVEQAMLRLFQLKHEIVLQTVVEGSPLASEYLLPKHILKSGPLPKVQVWTENSKNRKFITIVRALEAYGVDLHMLAQQWKKQFSTGCTVVDPSLDMTNLKIGTKIPLEIHVQGDLQVKVEKALLNEVRFPPLQLVSKNG